MRMCRINIAHARDLWYVIDRAHAGYRRGVGRPEVNYMAFILQLKREDL